MKMRGCHCEQSEAISVGNAMLIGLLRRSAPAQKQNAQPAATPWIPACAGMTEHLVSAATLSAPRFEHLAMTPQIFPCGGGKEDNHEQPHPSVGTTLGDACP